MDKGNILIASSMRVSAKFGFFVAIIMIITFIYSFIVPEPYAIDAYSRMNQTEHYNFIMSGRWWFLSAFFLISGMSFYSIKKAFNLENPKK